MKKLTNTDILLSLLIIELVKASILGGTTFDIAASVVLGALLGFTMYLNSTRDVAISKELSLKLEESELRTLKALENLDAKIGAVSLTFAKPKPDGQKFGW